MTKQTAAEIMKQLRSSTLDEDNCPRSRQRMILWLGVAIGYIIGSAMVAIYFMREYIARIGL